MSVVAAVAACVLLINANIARSAEVVYAVNCGGNEHVDTHGVRYQRDPLTVGTPSDYGRNLNIQRVLPIDAIIYQTERYHTQSFSYDLPLKGDGQYVLVLKFSEVWFTSPNQKVFGVMLNDEITVVDNLDIFYRVGLGVAHDEIVSFTVKDGRLCISPSECSDIYDSKFSVKFVKGDRDNPKVNAIVLYKGLVDEVPKLLPHPAGDRLRKDFERQREAEHHVDDEFDESSDDSMYERNEGSLWNSDANQFDSQIAADKRKILASGPPVDDPYATADSGSLLIPIVVAIGAFVPIVFCLCKV